jgi:hypothetical protein
VEVPEAVRIREKKKENAKGNKTTRTAAENRDELRTLAESWLDDQIDLLIVGREPGRV